jgi:hypothetical protein
MGGLFHGFELCQEKQRSEALEKENPGQVRLALKITC